MRYACPGPRAGCALCQPDLLDSGGTRGNPWCAPGREGVPGETEDTVVELARGKLPKQTRVTLVVVDVHSRDVVHLKILLTKASPTCL